MSRSGSFSRSADCYVELLGRISPQQWDGPALVSWNVRGLAGHTARAILTVENYLAHDEPGGVGIPAAEEYYSTVYSTLHDEAAIRADGISAGVWLADDAAPVSAAIARTAALLETQPENRAVSIGGMGILLGEYLRTRVVELVLHTIDLSHATGIDHGLPPELIAEAATLVAASEPHLRHGETRLLDPGFVSSVPSPRPFAVS